MKKSDNSIKSTNKEEVKKTMMKKYQRKKDDNKLDDTKVNETEIFGKYMLKDMPLFKYEMFAYFGLTIVIIMAYYLDLKGIVTGITRPLSIIAILVPVSLWFIKWNRYMPRRNRVPGLKLYKSGVVELGIYDISKGYISFGKGENLRKKWITKINKHIEASTGRPFIAVSELEGNNLNLLKTDQVDMKSEEFEAILEMNTAITTKNVMKRMLRFTQPSLSNPMMILQFMSLALLGVVIVKQLGIF